MTTFRPLRAMSNQRGPESPEGLLISALLETGEWTPDEYTVSDEDIEAWRPLWDFCSRYAARASGEAPPITLIEDRFPDFEITPNVSVTWAAGEVKDASDSRMMRVRTKEMLNALADDDLVLAYEALESVRPPRTSGSRPTTVFDMETVDRRETSVLFKAPYTTIARYFGGISTGELWYLAARTSHGKTWQLLNYANSAAVAGKRVAVLALEMTASRVKQRSLVVSTGGDTQLLAGLRSDDPLLQRESVTAIANMIPGKIDIYDLRSAPVNTMEFVRTMLNEYDLVLLDHVGLMTYKGGRALDDWRTQALISNELRNYTLTSGTPLIAAAQLNREGLRGSARKPPPLSAIWGSDALAQDADLVITMRRYSRRVMVQEAVKVRESEEPPRFYSWLDPKRGRFGEMSRDQAESAHDADGGDYRDED